MKRLLAISAALVIGAFSLAKAAVTVQAEAMTSNYGIVNGGTSIGYCDAGDWATYTVSIPSTGRYNLCFYYARNQAGNAQIWMEDFYDNGDGRTYDVTGKVKPPNTGGWTNWKTWTVYGLPLKAGTHKMKLHIDIGPINLDKMVFTLLRTTGTSPSIKTQTATSGTWRQVWADNFNGTAGSLPSTNNWTWHEGNWGWGNGEAQYYTYKNKANTYLNGSGYLVIHARKQSYRHASWTSGRLTTNGKVAFKYGRFEISTKPTNKQGDWGAGWLLGDSYKDESSWPYCGEVDIYEHSAKDGNVAHSSFHTRAHYFKAGATPRNVSYNLGYDITSRFTQYVLEWKPGRLDLFANGTWRTFYDQATYGGWWPFASPQAVILNNAMGGGMGGTIGSTITESKLYVDYVKVFTRY